jgi:hypothetical protein
MSGMMSVLKNKTVNSLTVAVILGFATLNFVGSIVSPIVGSIFDTSAADSWVWADFWANLVTYLVFWAVAVVVDQQAE